MSILPPLAIPGHYVPLPIVLPSRPEIGTPSPNDDLRRLADRLEALRLRHRLAEIHRAPRGPLSPYVARVMAYRACHETPTTRGGRR